MVHFTFKNGLAGKSLSVHNSFKSFIIMVVMLVLTTSSAFAEEIDGLNYKLDSETKTAILIPKTNGNIIRKTKCYRFTKRNVPKRKTKRLRYRCPPEPYSNSARTDFFSYSNAIILENQQINTSI